MRDILELVSLTKMQSWINCKPRKDAWHIECHQALSALHHAGNAVASSSTLTLYSGLVEGKYDDVFTEALDVDENQRTDLFRKSFGLKL